MGKDEGGRMKKNLPQRRALFFRLHPSSFILSAMFRWKEFRYRLEELGCRLLMRGLPRLSRRGCLRLANGLGALAYLLDARGRGVALSNLECVFGDRYTPAQRRAIARASYQNFLRTMLDLFWARNLRSEEHTSELQSQ